MEEMDKEQISNTCILLDSLKDEISSIQNSTVDMGELLDNIWKYFTALKDEITTSSEAQNTALQGKLAEIFESLNSFVELMTTMKIETGRVQDQMTFICSTYQQDENSTTLASETDSENSDSQSDDEDEDEATTNLNVNIKIKTENKDDASDYTINQNLQFDESTTLVESKDNICVPSEKGVVSSNSYTCVCCEQKFTRWQDLNTHLEEMHIRAGSSLGQPESFAGEKLKEIDDIKVSPGETGTADMVNVADRKSDHRSGRIIKKRAKRDGKHANTTAADPDSNVDPYGEKWPKDCGYCGKTFQEKATYDEHTRAFNSRCVRTFNCRYCSQRFTHRRGMRIHVRYWHLKLSQAKCDICGRMMSNKHALALHKLVHAGVKNFACEQCDERFTSKDTLERHVIRVHENRRDHVCEICAKAFHTMSNLNIHMKSHNIEGIEYKCEECGRVCNTAGNLKKHMFRHTEPQVPCDFCDLKFYEKGELTIHRRVHTGETPFNCNKCGKKFTHSSARRRHINSCGKEPTIACKFCGKKFHDKYTTKTHMMKSCAIRPKDEKELDKILEELEANDSVFSGAQKYYAGDVEPYRCSKCGKRFLQGKTFARHETVCGVEANLSCEMCGKKFVELWRLKQHEVKVHINGSKQPRKRKRIYVPKIKKEKPPPPPPKDPWTRKYSKESLVKAVEDVKDKKLSLATASKKYGIPKTTLFSHSTGRVTHLIQGLKEYSEVLGKDKLNEEDAEDDVHAEMEEHSGDSNHTGGDDCQEFDSAEEVACDMEGEGVMGIELDNDFKDVLKFHTSDLGPC